MATAHYATFGVSMQPAEADHDGYVAYSRTALRALQQAVRAGEGLQAAAERLRCSAGTVWVAEQTARIDEWRRQVVG